MPDARGVCWGSSTCSSTFSSQRLSHVPFHLRLLLLSLPSLDPVPFSVICPSSFRSDKTLNLELHFVVLRNAATPSTRPLTHSSGKTTLCQPNHAPFSRKLPTIRGTDTKRASGQHSFPRDYPPHNLKAGRTSSVSRYLQASISACPKCCVNSKLIEGR